MDEEIDKTSMKYFMTKMTQEEFDTIRNYRPSSCVRMGFETGLTRDERYIFNKIKCEYLDKLEKEDG